MKKKPIGQLLPVQTSSTIKSGNQLILQFKKNIGSSILGEEYVTVHLSLSHLQTMKRMLPFFEDHNHVSIQFLSLNILQGEFRIKVSITPNGIAGACVQGRLKAEKFLPIKNPVFFKKEKKYYIVLE